MKMFKNISIIIALLLVLTGCSNKNTHNNEIKQFIENIDAFQNINSLILDFATTNNIMAENEEFYFGIQYDENNTIVGISQYTDSLSKGDILSLTLINKLLHDDFDYIIYYGDRISYGGDGSRMYVYMFDDKEPSFFWKENEGFKFETYKICSNWFLLYHYFGR